MFKQTCESVDRSVARVCLLYTPLGASNLGNISDPCSTSALAVESHPGADCGGDLNLSS